MSDNIQHAPACKPFSAVDYHLDLMCTPYFAVKVGGRRLSISAKHKPTPHMYVVIFPWLGHTQDLISTITARAPSSIQMQNKDDAAGDDYPRPTAPTGDAPLQQNQHEEEVPHKKERKEMKLQETAHWKTETTRPTRDSHAASNTHGGGMRISQPAGKSLGV